MIGVCLASNHPTDASVSQFHACFLEDSFSHNRAWSLKNITAAPKVSTCIGISVSYSRGTIIAKFAIHNRTATVVKTYRKSPTWDACHAPNCPY